MKGFIVEADWAPKKTYAISQRELSLHEALRGNNIWRNIRGSLAERPMPQIKDDEVLIKVGACGICGSDLHVLEMNPDNYMVFSGHSKFPTIIGHEFSGEVIETGKDVRTVRVGDLVAVEEMQWCGECESCRIGRFNQCLMLEEPGLTIDGGFAEYAAVKEKFCCSINDIAEKLGDKQKALDAGALVEPASVAYNGMFVVAGGIHVGSPMAVFGAGPIGLAAIGLGIAAGATKIFAFDTIPVRRQLAKKMGADFVYDPIELSKQGIDPSDVIMEETKGLGVPTIVEATGNTKAVYPAISRSLAIGAKVIQLGMDAEQAYFDLIPFQYKHAHIYGSMGHAGSNIYPSVIRLMAAGRIDMLPMVTERFPLTEIKGAISKAESKETGKVLISQYY